MGTYQIRKSVKVFYRNNPDAEALSECILPIDEFMIARPDLVEKAIERELGPAVEILGVVYPKQIDLQTY